MSILDKRHDDWPWPFKYIPRKLNARESNIAPTAVAKSKGLAYADDIPDAGQWVITRGERWWEFFYFAWTGTKPDAQGRHWHFRIGVFRYDYVDKYYTYPTFTIKKIKL